MIIVTLVTLIWNCAAVYTVFYLFETSKTLEMAALFSFFFVVLTAIWDVAYVTSYWDTFKKLFKKK